MLAGKVAVARLSAVVRLRHALVTWQERQRFQSEFNVFWSMRPARTRERKATVADVLADGPVRVRASLPRAVRPVIAHHVVDRSAAVRLERKIG